MQPVTVTCHDLYGLYRPGLATHTNTHYVRHTLQDVDFHRKVQLTAQRTERVSGLCAHFDVAWTCRGRLEGGAAAGPIFSTGPLAASTSWLQTVFSFPKALQMEAGQELAVDFKVDSVGLPPGRMLDVSVEVEFQGMRATVPYQLKR